MKTFALAINLRDDPEVIERYKIEHTRVWPEVLERLREVGVQQMKIWAIGRHLFMYLETDDDFDPARDFARINEQARSAEWNKWMSESFQEPLPDARPGEWWARMDLAFDLRGALGEPSH